MDCPEAQMWTQLVYHRDKEMSSQMEHFIELLNDRLGMQPAGQDKKGVDHLFWSTPFLRLSVVPMDFAVFGGQL